MTRSASASRTLFLAGWILLAGCVAARSGVGLAAAQAGRFPPADRPVAPIVTPTYSTEAARDAHAEAERVLSRLGVKSGMRVADVGAGDGYYTVRLAKRLGPGATIYAEDVVQSHLDHLAARLARERIAGITLVHGTPSDPRLPPQSIELALLAHMYHEIQQPYEFVYRLYGALATGGRVAIIDNDKPTDKHGTPPALLRCELGAVGYREVDFLLLAPADGYLAVFAPPAALPRPEDIRPCAR
ncbi:MAG TPA: methyltransferase domain-containing protein [Methylomirabilota bacterium]|jgi:SAM-dependent methyltransferase